MSQSDFENVLRARNASALRVAAVLTTVLVPAFWGADFVIMPELVWRTLWLRALVTASAAALLWGFRARPEWTERHAIPIGFAMAVLVAWMVAFLCWLRDGYESPYYAGLNLVFLAAGFLFSWPPRLVLAFHATVYGFYMAPLALSLVPVRDGTVFVNSQFFLFSTMLITQVSQRHRFLLERREHAARTEQQALLAEVRAAATTDALTGAYTRGHLFMLGEQEVARARRYGHALAVLMLDVDFFKSINDGHGHAVGDEVLRAVAGRVVANCRQPDMVGRFGGDELVVLLPETGEEAAHTLAERMRVAVCEHPVMTSCGPLAITLSVGAAALSAADADFEALLARADEALYAAKRAGRARSVGWTPPRVEPPGRRPATR